DFVQRQRRELGAPRVRVGLGHHMEQVHLALEFAGERRRPLQCGLCRFAEIGWNEDSVNGNHVSDLLRKPRAYRAGSRIKATVPPLGGQSSESDPPCPSSMRRAVGNPSPVPLCFVVKNGSNRCSCTSAGIPAPWSLIRSPSHPAPPRWARTIMLP